MTATSAERAGAGDGFKPELDPRVDRERLPRRIGVLGGTFSPPHLAHLICAQEAAEQLRLDRVLLMPASVPPHKQVPLDPGPQARAELCRRAIGDDPRLSVSMLELERAGPSYTVDTLRTLHERAPQDELMLIVGGDMAHSLPSWREPLEILRLARLAVAEREGIGRRDILEQLAALPGSAERVDFFDLPRLDISSSLVRRRISSGRSIRYLVPDAVAAYVTEHRLYLDPDAAPGPPLP